MAQRLDKAREKSSRPLTFVDFSSSAAALVREIAQPYPGENGKAALARAAENLGLSPARARRLYFGEGQVRVGEAEFTLLRANAVGALQKRKAWVVREMARLGAVIATMDSNSHAARTDVSAHSWGWLGLPAVSDGDFQPPVMG